MALPIVSFQTTLNDSFIILDELQHFNLDKQKFILTLIYKRAAPMNIQFKNLLDAQKICDAIRLAFNCRGDSYNVK